VTPSRRPMRGPAIRFLLLQGVTKEQSQKPVNPTTLEYERAPIRSERFGALPLLGKYGARLCRLRPAAARDQSEAHANFPRRGRSLSRPTARFQPVGETRVQYHSSARPAVTIRSHLTITQTSDACDFSEKRCGLFGSCRRTNFEIVERSDSEPPQTVIL